VRTGQAYTVRWSKALLGIGGLATLGVGGGVVVWSRAAAPGPIIDFWQVRWFCDKAVGRIGENLHDLIASPINPADRFFLGYIVSCLAFGAVAFALEQRRRSGPDRPGLLRFLFPPQVYRHRSARVDYAVFLLNRILTPAVLITRLWTGASLAAGTTALLVTVLGVPAHATLSAVWPGFWGVALFTLISALVFDFADYLSHALHHRIPLLWEFHKLHHSAEVMTPITTARVHPVEQIVGALVPTPIVGLFTGIVGYALAQPPQPLLFFGAQAVPVLFFAAGYHLRHSHVWLSWGWAVGHLLISPAQHQIHHSRAAEHWNRNYGFVFAIWDWMFGTLYVPRGRETLRFGIADEPALHGTVWAAYVDPVRNAVRLIDRAIRPALVGRRDDVAVR
jgi:sterol desaturase/sphingolipid hydroxylase (fatty acid hydroxylase superfamily)